MLKIDNSGAATVDLASPGAIGGTTPAAGTFTDLGFSGLTDQGLRTLAKLHTDTRVMTFPMTSIGAQAVVSGSGQAGGLNHGGHLSTGATAGSRAQYEGPRVSSRNFIAPDGGSPDKVDMASPFALGIAVAFEARTANGTAFFRFANFPASWNTGELAGAGVGFRIDDLTIKAQVHDGTTLTTSSSGIHTIGGTMQIARVQIIKVASGTFEFWINGSLADTLSGGPTGSVDSLWGIEALNNADAVSHELLFSNLKIFTA